MALGCADPREGLLQRIRSMAKDHPLRIFLMAEASKLAIAVMSRQHEVESARA